MMTSYAALLLVSLGVTVTAFVDQGWDVTTKLDEYVHRDDGRFSWTELSENRDELLGYTNWVVNMTSQQWYTEEVSSQPIWWHWMIIACPDTILHPKGAFLFIDGGSNRGNPPPGDDLAGTAVGTFANTTGMCGGILRMVPNQPIWFPDDPSFRRRSEDSIIAYTWRKYMLGEADEEYLLQFPQTKAGKRGLDTIYEVARQKRPETNATQFIVAGASKRGWTSWLLACVDRRVVGIAPMVMSLLKTVPTLMHHYRSLGGWSHALGSYYRENITQFLTTPAAQRMANHIDPYSYRSRLTMPKVIISGAGDEFFLCDDSHYYFDELPGEKYMLMMENTNHGMDPHYLRIADSIIPFTKSIFRNLNRPTLFWQRNETATSGSITLETGAWTPSSVRAWMADTLDDDAPLRRRDFRLTAINRTTGEPDLHPVWWAEYEVDQIANNVFMVEFDKPVDLEGERRWRAFFIEVKFPMPEDNEEEYEFTTEVNIIPDNFHYPPCEGTGCWGVMV